MLWICDISVQIRILESVKLTYGFGYGFADPYHWLTDPDPFPSVADKMSTKNNKYIFSKFFCLLDFWRYIYINFFTFFACWWRDPDPNKIMTDPDPVGQKAYGCYGSGLVISLRKCDRPLITREKSFVKLYNDCGGLVVHGCFIAKNQQMLMCRRLYSYFFKYINVRLIYLGTSRLCLGKLCFVLDVHCTVHRYIHTDLYIHVYLSYSYSQAH